MAATAQPGSHDRLRERSIGLPQVLFQSITHMAPGAAIAFSILFSVQFAGPALPLAALLALVACLLVASSIGQMAKKIPSAGGLYSYVTHGLGKVPGFMVGLIFLCFQPLVAPLLFLIFAWATEDVVKNDLNVSTSTWWLWVLVAAGIVFVLAYRDVRLSTNAGVILGIFEIAVFAALAIWMILSNLGDLSLSPFDARNAEAGTFNGIFKGMVFTILAFIGFEASAPLGEEAERPRWTIPRAVVGSCLAIGIFYVLCSYAWVIGTNGNFTEATLAQANPWRHLADVYWGGGWVLIFLAIVNSALANSNAGVNAASRVMYAMGRNGVLPAAFARTHPVHRTPHVAIVAQMIFGVVLALLMGWKWGPLNAFGIISYAAVSLVILVYIATCLACVAYYWTRARDEFNVWLHGVFPVLGSIVFLPPLYYQFRPLPDYPLRWGNWFGIAAFCVALAITAYVATQRRDLLEGADRIFVEEEVIVGPAGPDMLPPRPAAAA
jgi:amino acid transporter